MADSAPTYTCAQCSAIYHKKRSTHCTADPDQARPPAPANCPAEQAADVIAKAAALSTGDGDEARIARVAAQVEGACYESPSASGNTRARWTRVEDTIAFAKRMGYQRIGIATCIGLIDETRRLAAILSAQGLEPVSVCCKSGGIDKKALGLAEADKVRPGRFEAMCNPIAQAFLLNQAKTDMNVLVGLCVGHDMLFNRHSVAPVTTLVAKDRVTGHNPASVLYGQNHYYRRLLHDPVDGTE